MRDPEFLNKCDEALEQLLRSHQHTPYVLQVADIDRSPLRGTSYDSDLVSGGTGSDPTGQSAIAPPRSAVAKANLVSAWCRIHEAVAVVLFETETLQRMDIDFSQRLERSKAKDLRRRRDRAAETARRLDAELQVHQDSRQAQNDARCASCARVERSPGVAWDCGAKPGKGGNLRRSDCGGVLDEPRPLCKWTRDYVATYGHLPTTEEVEQRRDKGDNIRKTA